MTGETGRGGCGPGGELSSGRGCETEKRCLEGSRGAVKFGFFGEHVVLGKMSSPGSEGHQGRTCLLRGGDMSRRCSRKREEGQEEGVRAVGWARDSQGPELPLASLRAFTQQHLAHGQCLLSTCCGPRRRHQRVSSNRGVEQSRLSRHGAPGGKKEVVCGKMEAQRGAGPQQVLCSGLAFYIKVSPAWYFQPGRHSSPPRGRLRPTGARGTPMVTWGWGHAEPGPGSHVPVCASQPVCSSR